MSTSTPSSRLHQVSQQLSPNMATAFDASVVPQAPEDPLFGLMAAYRKDADPNKVSIVFERVSCIVYTANFLI